MKILKIVGAVVGAIALAILVLFTAARSADGPIAIIPGGSLRSGQLVDAKGLDWSFARDVQEIEMFSDGRSRTVWVVVVDGQAYIPCSLNFPPFKTWHKKIDANPDAMLRVQGRRYRVKLRGVTDPALFDRIAEAAGAKYPTPPPGTGERSSETIRFFRVDPA